MMEPRGTIDHFILFLFFICDLTDCYAECFSAKDLKVMRKLECWRRGGDSWDMLQNAFINSE